MTKIKTDIFDTLFDTISAPYTDLIKLAAIWLPKPIKTATESKRRIATNDLIQVQDSKLIDCTTPTHVIIDCYGTMANTKFEIKAKNINTNQIETIEI